MTDDKTPPGLRKPWIWIQPQGLEEILSRLARASDCAVPERERENMCAVAYHEIKRMRNHELKLAAMVRWLEQHQPDVFRRGMWEAIAEAEKDNR